MVRNVARSRAVQTFEFPPEQLNNQQRKEQKQMKTGRSLREVAAQIKREASERKDFRVPTEQLNFRAEQNGSCEIGFKVKRDNYSAAPTRHCLRQICARSGIPAQYVDKMLAQDGGNGLLADNVNWWWKNAPEKRMLRTLLNGSHIARAFLSERYRPLENADLAAAILPRLEKLDCEVLSCEITETRFYIQAATPKIEAKLVGDRVRAGIVISNSEVGCGSLGLDPLLYYLRCLNGMVMPRVMQRYHIGRKSDPLFELDSAAEYYTDATREMDDRAFWMKVQDVAEGLFDKDRFKALVDKFESATEQKVKPVEAVEEITERFKFNDTEQAAVLNHLIEGGQANVFGLINAVTRTATDVESYDRSIQLQRVGGEILELPKSVWQRL
jgi:hypothetical protein